MNMTSPGQTAGKSAGTAAAHLLLILFFFLFKDIFLWRFLLGFRSNLLFTSNWFFLLPSGGWKGKMRRFEKSIPSVKGLVFRNWLRRRVLRKPFFVAYAVFYCIFLYKLWRRCWYWAHGNVLLWIYRDPRIRRQKENEKKRKQEGEEARRRAQEARIREEAERKCVRLTKLLSFPFHELKYARRRHSIFFLLFICGLAGSAKKRMRCDVRRTLRSYERSNNWRGKNRESGMRRTASFAWQNNNKFITVLWFFSNHLKQFSTWKARYCRSCSGGRDFDGCTASFVKRQGWHTARIWFNCRTSVCS